MEVGPFELLMIGAIILLFFGPSRLPGLAKGMGEAIRGFKKGLAGDDVTPAQKSSPPPQPQSQSQAEQGQPMPSGEKKKDHV